MPIAANNTVNTLLQMSQQAAQRRDNLHAAYMQGQQATNQMQMGLLQAMVQNEQFQQSLGQRESEFSRTHEQRDDHFGQSLGQADRHFQMRHEQVDDHFRDQMSFAKDQQEFEELDRTRKFQLNLLENQQRATLQYMQGAITLDQYKQQIHDMNRQAQQHAEVYGGTASQMGTQFYDAMGSLLGMATGPRIGAHMGEDGALVPGVMSGGATMGTGIGGGTVGQPGVPGGQPGGGVGMPGMPSGPAAPHGTEQTGSFMDQLLYNPQPASRAQRGGLRSILDRGLTNILTLGSGFVPGRSGTDAQMRSVNRAFDSLVQSSQDPDTPRSEFDSGLWMETMRSLSERGGLTKLYAGVMGMLDPERLSNIVQDEQELMPETLNWATDIRQNYYMERGDDFETAHQKALRDVVPSRWRPGMEAQRALGQIEKRYNHMLASGMAMDYEQRSRMAHRMRATLTNIMEEKQQGRLSFISPNERTALVAKYNELAGVYNSLAQETGGQPVQYFEEQGQGQGQQDGEGQRRRRISENRFLQTISPLGTGLLNIFDR